MPDPVDELRGDGDLAGLAVPDADPLARLARARAGVLAGPAELVAQAAQRRREQGQGAAVSLARAMAERRAQMFAPTEAGLPGGNGHKPKPTRPTPTIPPPAAPAIDLRGEYTPVVAPPQTGPTFPPEAPPGPMPEPRPAVPELPARHDEAMAIVNELRSRAELRQMEEAGDRTAKYGEGIIPRPLYGTEPIPEELRPSYLRRLIHPTKERIRQAFMVPKKVGISLLAEKTIDAERDYRIEAGLYNPDEVQRRTFEDWYAQLPQKYQQATLRDGTVARWRGTSWYDTSKLETNLARELGDGLPMYAPEAAELQERLYQDMRTVQPDELPAARGVLEKLATFTGELGPFIAELRVARAGIDKALGKVPAYPGRTTGRPRTPSGAYLERRDLGIPRARPEHMGREGLAVGGVELSRGVPPEEAVESGAMFAGLAGLHGLAHTPYTKGVVTGAVFGSKTAIEGGDPQDILIAGVIAPLLFHLPDMARYPFRPRGLVVKGRPAGPDAWRQWGKPGESQVKRMIHSFRTLGEQAGREMTADARITWEIEIGALGRRIQAHVERAQAEPRRYTREDAAILEQFALHYAPKTVTERQGVRRHESVPGQEEIQARPEGAEAAGQELGRRPAAQEGPPAPQVRPGAVAPGIRAPTRPPRGLEPEDEVADIDRPRSAGEQYSARLDELKARGWSDAQIRADMDRDFPAVQSVDDIVARLRESEIPLAYAALLARNNAPEVYEKLQEELPDLPPTVAVYQNASIPERAAWEDKFFEIIRGEVPPSGASARASAPGLTTPAGAIPASAPEQKPYTPGERFVVEQTQSGGYRVRDTATDDTIQVVPRMSIAQSIADEYNGIEADAGRAAAPREIAPPAPGERLPTEEVTAPPATTGKSIDVPGSSVVPEGYQITPWPNGVHVIRFRRNPGKTVLDRLKSQGIRWHRRARGHISKVHGPEGIQAIVEGRAAPLPPEPAGGLPQPPPAPTEARGGLNALTADDAEDILAIATKGKKNHKAVIHETLRRRGYKYSAGSKNQYYEHPSGLWRWKIQPGTVRREKRSSPEGPYSLVMGTGTYPTVKQFADTLRNEMTKIRAGVPSRFSPPKPRPASERPQEIEERQAAIKALEESLRLGKTRRGEELDATGRKVVEQLLERERKELRDLQLPPEGLPREPEAAVGGPPAVPTTAPAEAPFKVGEQVQRLDDETIFEVRSIRPISGATDWHVEIADPKTREVFVARSGRLHKPGESPTPPAAGKALPPARSAAPPAGPHVGKLNFKAFAAQQGFAELPKVGTPDHKKLLEVFQAYKGQVPAAQEGAQIFGEIFPEIIPAKTVGAPDDKRIEKLRENADKLQKTIDAKYHPAVADQAPTRRRAGQIESAYGEAEALEQQQKWMRAIADAIEAGTLPEILDPINSRAMLEDLQQRRDPPLYQHVRAIEELVKWSQTGSGSKGSKVIAARNLAKAWIRGVPEGAHGTEILDMGTAEAIETLSRNAKGQGKSGYDLVSVTEPKRWLKALGAIQRARGKTNNAGTPIMPDGPERKAIFEDMRKALAELVKGKKTETPAHVEKQRLEAELIGRPIEGFFPTTEEVAKKMIDLADLEPDHKILEPSAGKGDIADAVAADVVQQPSEIDVVEVNNELRKILEHKGYNLVGSDFLEYQPGAVYDRILMNPPFEKNKDIIHVRHAYELLKPGGWLVAIMGRGAFFRSGKTETAFRDWLEELDAHTEELPEGSFTTSFRPTGVAANLVVIEKPAEAVSATVTPPAPPGAPAGQVTPRSLAVDVIGKEAVKAAENQGFEFVEGKMTKADLEAVGVRGVIGSKDLKDLSALRTVTVRRKGEKPVEKTPEATIVSALRTAADQLEGKPELHPETGLPVREGPGQPSPPRAGDPKLGQELKEGTVVQVWRTATAEEADGLLHVTVRGKTGPWTGKDYTYVGRETKPLLKQVEAKPAETAKKLELRELTPSELEDIQRLEAKLPDLEARLDRINKEGAGGETARVAKHFHLGRVGGSGKPAKKLDKIREREIDKAIELSKKAQRVREQIVRIEMEIDKIRKAPKKEAQNAALRAHMQTQFAAIRVGDYIDIGGQRPIKVVKKNRKTVVTGGGEGVKWDESEIVRVYTPEQIAAVEPLTEQEADRLEQLPAETRELRELLKTKPKEDPARKRIQAQIADFKRQTRELYTRRTLTELQGSSAQQLAETETNRAIEEAKQEADNGVEQPVPPAAGSNAAREIEKAARQTDTPDYALDRGAAPAPDSTAKPGALAAKPARLTEEQLAYVPGILKKYDALGYKDWTKELAVEAIKVIRGLDDKTRYVRPKSGQEEFPPTYPRIQEISREAHAALQREMTKIVIDETTTFYGFPGAMKNLRALAEKAKKITPKKPGTGGGSGGWSLAGPFKAKKPSQPLGKPHKGSSKDKLLTIDYGASADPGRYKNDGILVTPTEMVVTDGRRLWVQRGEFAELTTKGTTMYRVGQKKAITVYKEPTGYGGYGGAAYDAMELDDGGMWAKVVRSVDDKGNETVNTVGRFPKYQEVIPFRGDVIRVPVEETYHHVRQALAIAELGEAGYQGIIVVRNPDDSLGFVAYAHDKGQAEINVKDGGEILGGVAPQLLMDQLWWHYKDGDESIDLSWEDTDRPLRTDGANTTGVLMPLNVKESHTRAIAQRIVKPGLYQEDVDRAIDRQMWQPKQAKAAGLKTAWRNNETGEVIPTKDPSGPHNMEDLGRKYLKGKNTARDPMRADLAIEPGYLDADNKWIPMDEAWVPIVDKWPLKKALETAGLVDSKTKAEFNPDNQKHQEALSEAVAAYDSWINRDNAGLDPRTVEVLEARWDEWRGKLRNLLKPPGEVRYHPVEWQVMDYPIPKELKPESPQARALHVAAMKTALAAVEALKRQGKLKEPAIDHEAIQTLTEEQLAWLRKQPKDKPKFGMGGMLNVPDARNWWAHFVDSTLDRITNLPPDTIRRSLVDWVGRGIFDERWGLSQDVYEHFQQVKGKGKEFAGRTARAVNNVVRKGTAEKIAARQAIIREAKTWAEKQKAIDKAKADYHRAVEDLLRGDKPLEQATPEQKRIIELYAPVVDESTDFILNNPWTWPHMQAFGLRNIHEVIRMKREGPGHYLRRLYEWSPAELFGRQPAREDRLVGPRIRGGMFMPRRGDEDLYTLVDWTERAMNGGPEMKQYASQEEARDEWDKRIKLKSQEWGERVFEKIKVLDPFDVDSLEEQIAEARASGDIAKLATLPKPIRDVEVLIARTLLDQLVNVETLKLFKYLADTVAQDGEAPGYRYVPKHPAFGPLADKWVPEPVEYALQQRERVSTNFWSQLWATGYYYWKSAHVSWSPPTAGRQLMGIVTLQSLDGMNPVTDAPWLKRAVDQFRFAAANPSDPRAADWRRLVEENQITGGWTLDEADALARYVNENPTRWGPAVVKWVESHPRFVAAVRGAGRRVEKADEAAGRLYGLPDQAAKLASYLKKRHKWGWTHREASRSLWMYMNYGRAGRWAKKLRRHILGNPFVMFTEQAGKIFARAVRDRPIRLALLGASPHLMTLFSRLVLGVDDDEMDLLNSSPNRSRSWVDQYFQPMMPWRDGNGDPAFFDIRWVFPLASEFRVETGTHGLGIPLFLGHPFVSGAHEVLFNRDSWTGRDLFDRDLTPLQKLPGALAHMAEAMAPLPTLVHKPGGGGIKKMWDAYRGERDESFARAMAREVFGVSFKDPWIRRVDVLRLIEEKLGRNEREAAEHIMTLFNVVYRAEYAPIGPREAIRRAAR